MRAAWKCPGSSVISLISALPIFGLAFGLASVASLALGVWATTPVKGANVMAAIRNARVRKMDLRSVIRRIAAGTYHDRRPRQPLCEGLGPDARVEGFGQVG